VRLSVRLGVLGAAALLLAGCTSAAPAPEATPSATRTVAFAGSGFAPCPAPTGAPLASGGLAPVTVPCMDGSGRSVRLDRPTGRPLVVNLWASWCPPCGTELPAFQRLHADAAGSVVVLGVVTADGEARSVGAGQALDLTFANVYDRDAAVRRALGVNALPATAFVGPDGRVRHVHRSTPLDDGELRRLVERHLGVRVR